MSSTTVDIFAISPEGYDCHFAITNEKTYDAARLLMRKLKEDGFTPRPAKPHQTHRAGAQAASSEEKLCPIHHVAMKARTNDRGTWFSHKLESGGWCTGAEPKS